MDAWLDTIEPAQFDEWLAFRQIEPDPDDRLREVLKMGFAMLARSWGNEKIEPDDLDPWGRDEKAQSVSPNRAAAIVGAAYGFR